MLSVLDQWVETGKAPDRIIASNPPNQKPMSRPVCPYPRLAAYKGSGSTDDAASFGCKAQ
jgi:feruloyl esterase